MRHIKTGRNRALFSVLSTTMSAQSAMMTLQPGQSTGEPQNEHPLSEQWLFVVSGSGSALVKKRRVPIRENSLLLIEKGEVHQVTNTGRHAMVTLNFYAPPAYSKDGEPKKRRHSRVRMP